MWLIGLIGALLLLAAYGAILYVVFYIVIIWAAVWLFWILVQLVFGISFSLTDWLRSIFWKTSKKKKKDFDSIGFGYAKDGGTNLWYTLILILGGPIGWLGLYILNNSDMKRANREYIEALRKLKVLEDDYDKHYGKRENRWT